MTDNNSRVGSLATGIGSGNTGGTSNRKVGEMNKAYLRFIQCRDRKDKLKIRYHDGVSNLLFDCD